MRIQNEISRKERGRVGNGPKDRRGQPESVGIVYDAIEYFIKVYRLGAGVKYYGIILIVALFAMLIADEALLRNIFRSDGSRKN